MTYQEFLQTKELQTIQAGFDVDKDNLNNQMFLFHLLFYKGIQGN